MGFGPFSRQCVLAPTYLVSRRQHNLSQEKLAEYVNSRLKPLALEAARCNVGSAASEAAWLHGGQHITEVAANEVHKVMELTRSFTDQWRLHKQCIQGRLDSLADSVEEANTVREADAALTVAQTRVGAAVQRGTAVLFLIASISSVSAGSAYLTSATGLLLSSAAGVPHLHGQGEPHREAHL